MARFRAVAEPSIINPPGSGASVTVSEPAPPPRMTVTGAIGAVCMFPLRAIINLCVALRIHPNTLTLIGVIVNVGAS